MNAPEAQKLTVLRDHLRGQSWTPKCASSYLSLHIPEFSNDMLLDEGAAASSSTSQPPAAGACSLLDNIKAGCDATKQLVNRLIDLDCGAQGRGTRRAGSGQA